MVIMPQYVHLRDELPLALRIAPSGNGVEMGLADCGGESLVYVERYQERLVVRVWADPDTEEPTHTIDCTDRLREILFPQSEGVNDDAAT